MQDSKLNIVWFKRDLRWQDHRPLLESVQKGPTIGLFIVEPEWLGSAEFSSCHLEFARQSLRDLEDALLKMKIPLYVVFGEATEVFQLIRRQVSVGQVFSHEETGLLWSYERDKKMKVWFRDQGIPWIECRQFGVLRPLKNRDQWAGLRTRVLDRPLLASSSQQSLPATLRLEGLNWDSLIKKDDLKPQAQVGGRSFALDRLRRFLERDSEKYTSSLSSPRLAFEGCSRLSPYLAWGNLSMSEVLKAIQKRRGQLESEPPWVGRFWLRSLEQFESRLWWHCHFIQKLESEPEIEFENVNREFDGLRESEFCETKFIAWCKGETGFPLIDACMRALHQHGWINFRMRAMLMSFASYQLWLHWRRPAQFLARQFIDFEPGIHYPQVQMQSGVTGINTIRIYSPLKQQLDQDPQGLFVRRYIPELHEVDLAEILRPGETPPLLLLDRPLNASRYPAPIVDPQASYQQAKDRIFAWKKKARVKAAAKKVYDRHGSRKGPHFPQQNRGTFDDQ